MNMLKKGPFFFFTFFFSTNAYAAHPLITDDTGTQGKRKFQIEINSEFSTDKGRENRVSEQVTSGEAGTTLSYGIADTIDLVVGLPLQWYTIREGGRSTFHETGFGDMTAELKWRFLDSEEQKVSLALKPALSIPTGSEEKGLGCGMVSGGVTMIATSESELGALHCNLGYRHNKYSIEKNRVNTRNDIWHASLAAELNMTGNLRSVTNVGVETNEERRSNIHPVFLIGGIIYSIHENLDIDCGLKCGLNETETDTTFLAGLAARF